ncbi:hypothetical protein HanHA300_Chr16g0627621 [Helianthus annuus]|nr:hypothetical protein HanHA300_Chr16g0627621 [Helianthus annuus]KAJ0462037.1 hypothetical protein HanHA89_Chr16g0678961 [Helianthus annuus]KAJ0642431.1 hypothetical protein HanLR1_Chr16g0638171 [Helianthus annuus]
MTFNLYDPVNTSFPLDVKSKSVLHIEMAEKNLFLKRVNLSCFSVSHIYILNCVYKLLTHLFWNC